MQCIDFDQHFHNYIKDYLKMHKDEYANVDEIEAKMPEIYAEYLLQPADWLDGQKPGTYFEQFSDAQALVEWMMAYHHEQVSVPDLLLNRIAELGEAAESALMPYILQENLDEHLMLHVISLLRELGSMKPMKQYADWQAERREGADEVADRALESLSSMGEAAVPAMLSVFQDATPAGQEALLTVLSHYSMPDYVFETALQLLQTRPDSVTINCDCIARMGDTRALPVLMRMAANDETEYLDYIELRNAIEVLGGDAPERDFEAIDPLYEYLRQQQDEQHQHAEE